MSSDVKTNADLPRRKLERFANLAETCVHRGDFALTRGDRVDWYVDGRALLLARPAAIMAGQLLCGLLRPDLRCVGGPATAALPVVAAIVHQSLVRIEGFYVRHDPHNHGLNRRIEGMLAPSVAVVDDTCTTGGSLLECIRAVEAEGSVVEQVLTVFDRGDGGQRLRDAGYDYAYVLRLEDGAPVLPWRTHA